MADDRLNKEREYQESHTITSGIDNVFGGSVYAKPKLKSKSELVDDNGTNESGFNGLLSTSVYIVILNLLEKKLFGGLITLRTNIVKKGWFCIAPFRHKKKSYGAYG